MARSGDGGRKREAVGKSEAEKVSVTDFCTLSHMWIGLKNSLVSQEHSVYVSVCVLKGVALNEVYNTFQCSRLKGVSLQQQADSVREVRGEKTSWTCKDDEVRQVNSPRTQSTFSPGLCWEVTEPDPEFTGVSQ